MSGEQDYSALGKQPIGDAQPAGSDVRSDDDYDTLQTEIGKMSNPVASGSIDWQQVATLSETILSTKSKDLLVASYLTGALLQTRDLPGLLDGLRVVGGMLETYWDTLFPPLARLRGRRNALQWLIERVTAHSEEHDWSALPPQEPELVDGLRACMRAIDAVTADLKAKTKEGIVTREAMRQARETLGDLNEGLASVPTDAEREAQKEGLKEAGEKEVKRVAGIGAPGAQPAP